MTKAIFRMVSLFAAFFVIMSAAAQDKPPMQPDYPLGGGDDIRILVFQNPDLTTEARVSENGKISFPLIGEVQIGGLSVGEAEKRIASALKDGGFVQQPQVNIVLVAVRGSQVSVLGQVNRPGRFPLETLNVRVSDILAAAGGVTPAGDDIAILTGQRDGKPFRKEIDIPALYLGGKMDNDIVLAAGDSIYVHRAPIFYIYGEAQHPGPYRIERGMTVMQALAQGGGLTPRGTEYRLRLNRRNADGAVETLFPKMTDPVLANDVIYVRESIF